MYTASDRVCALGIAFMCGWVFSAWFGFLVNRWEDVRHEETVPAAKLAPVYVHVEKHPNGEVRCYAQGIGTDRSLSCIWRSYETEEPRELGGAGSDDDRTGQLGHGYGFRPASYGF